MWWRLIAVGAAVAVADSAGIGKAGPDAEAATDPNPVAVN